MSQHQANQNN